MEQNPKNLWEQCRKLIRDNVAPEQYNALFAYTEFDSYANGRLVLSVPSQFIFDYLETDQYANLIKASIGKYFGEGTELAYKIAVVQKPKEEIQVVSKDPKGIQNGSQPQIHNEAPDVLMAPSVQDLDSQLHRGYFFTNYYEGESNRLARSVGEAIAKDPAKTFNPFFIYGPSGCGKTHLVNAIGWRIKELHPELRVLYLSAHLFTVQYTNAVMQNKLNDFIAFYQTIDVLILDDCQELSGKKATQNTFFHIFNHLHLNGKQLILTADRPPMLIENLEDRLLTRFKWGLQAEIEKPTRALRYRILKGKCETNGLRIPDNVLGYIADHLDQSVRDLEGIVTSLMAYSIALNCEVNMKLVNQLMPRFVNVEKTNKETTVEEIRKKVCEYYDISEDVVNSKSRTQKVSYIRQVAIYLSNRHTNCSTVQIGRTFGGRNHATILHSLKTMNNLIETDEKIRHEVEEVEALL